MRDATPTSDERRLLLDVLQIQRELVLRTAAGLDDDQARWTPGDRLTPIIGIINHLAHVEWRWIDGRYRGEPTSRSEREFRVPRERPLAEVVAAYVDRARRTAEAVEAAPDLLVDCSGGPGLPPMPGIDLRWVLLHLIEETAHHAGHADATREMLDGTRF